jgi:hypothetical protein
MMDLQSYVSKNLNAILLPVSQELIIPGAVLDIEWEKGTLYTLKKIFSIGIYQQKYTVQTFKGYIWKYNHYDSSNFDSKLIIANVPKEIFTQNYKIINSILLPQYGINVSSLFHQYYKCCLTIDEIKIRILNNPQIMFKVHNDFSQNSFISEYSTGDLIVTESFYATKLKWEFDKNTDINLILNYLKMSHVQDNFTYSLDTTQTIEISGQPTVPFAVRGMFLNKD